jgi:hypothetical protein
VTGCSTEPSPPHWAKTAFLKKRAGNRSPRTRRKKK